VKQPLLALAAMLVAAAPVPVTKTPAGGYVIGSRAAKVKVVEYLSYSCPHCAHFAVEGWPKLTAGYLTRGTASLEVRHAIRDRYDFAAALLARCRGAATFESDSAALFAGQQGLMTKAMAYEDAANDTAASLTARLAGIARASGMIALMQGRGLVPARAQACLANAAEQRTLLAMTDEAQKRGIPYTPALYVNGALAGSSWDDLAPKLAAAAKR